jgi:cytochrome c peroxidase
MRFSFWKSAALMAALSGVLFVLLGRDPTPAQEPPKPLPPSPAPPAGNLDSGVDFEAVMAKMKAAKPDIMKKHAALLAARYDLGNRPSKTMMSGGRKPLQEGVRVKLSKGLSWDKLSAMTPEEIHAQDVFPRGFMPLPHPNHDEGGMLFPKFHIDEIKKQEGRDLTRFDLDFDLPDHHLPEFPPPIFLTTRLDLGDVSKGKLVTLANFYDLFKDVFNSKQIEGLRLLLTPFPQQQFNQTHGRRSENPSRGVTCFDCHINGHTNGATHLAPDVRPQEFRHRIETPTLRGVNVARLFGSQRALRSIEDFTEFEQRGAYFDGDFVTAIQKGINILDRGHQVHAMAEVQELLDFPPAPKLTVLGKLDPKKATQAELRGQELFLGKAQCAVCHPAPFYTDNMMHNLKAERFFKARKINGAMAAVDGPIKTFSLRGIKDSPPYLHDGRLLTLEDTVEFFNLILELRLNEQEKGDLVAFMRAL